MSQMFHENHDCCSLCIVLGARDIPTCRSMDSELGEKSSNSNWYCPFKRRKKSNAPKKIHKQQQQRTIQMGKSRIDGIQKKRNKERKKGKKWMIEWLNENWYYFVCLCMYVCARMNWLMDIGMHAIQCTYQQPIPHTIPTNVNFVALHIIISQWHLQQTSHNTVGLSSERVLGVLFCFYSFAFCPRQIDLLNKHDVDVLVHCALCKKKKKTHQY